MNKLKVTCWVLSASMLMIVIFLQVLAPISPQGEWENVNKMMAATLEQTHSSLPAKTPPETQEPLPDNKSETPPPTEIEQPESQLTLEVQQPSLQNDLINLNSATLEQLDLLPGIGPSKAKAIIDYRTKYGNFHSLEQIMEVKGIGPKIFEKMKEIITI